MKFVKKVKLKNFLSFGKYVTTFIFLKVDENFNLKNLFSQHISMFDLKNDQELIYLDDVKNFIEKKNQLELQYSQALSKLCSQYMSKSEYQLNSDSTSQIYITEKWKVILDQYAYIAEKKQVSSRSILLYCEYFKKIKEQKVILNQMAINHLKKNQKILDESHRNYTNAFKSFCIDQFLIDQIDPKIAQSNSNLDKKLKAKNINLTKFKKALNEITENDRIKKERVKKLDFSKLNYVTTNYCQNQQLQYYYSMEIPQLLQLQNSCIDAFIEESLNTLILKEVESNKFLVHHFEDSILNVFKINNDSERQNFQNNSSEAYFIDQNDCFYNLVQFDLIPHDRDFQPSFFSFQKDNIKHLSDDYVKWSAKLSELESLMSAMLTKVNEERFENGELNKNLQGVMQTSDFAIDQKLEDQRFLIAEKKLQMIQLQAKIDALGSFNINLNDLEKNNDLNKFEENKSIFEANLHQNLELWDQLMKSIDNIQYSDESYDYEYIRKNSKELIQSEESNDSKYSFSIFDPKSNETISNYSNIPNITPRYALTLDAYFSDDKNYLNFEKDQSIIVYDEIYNGVYRAKNYAGMVGLVGQNFIEFYDDEIIYVKSIYVYDGLDEQELSFPPDSYIRLLRKHTKKKKIDDEEWWEGAYDDKIGFFPSIFVQEMENLSNKENNQDVLSCSDFRMEIKHQVQSPNIENQKVPD